VPVLVDTPVWSFALRRRRDSLTAAEAARVAILQTFLQAGEAVIIGPVRQELLTGIRDHATYLRLRDRLRAFVDVGLAGEDYERAAEFANTCVKAGEADSPVDYIVCSAAVKLNAPIFTADSDFARYARLLPISLYGNNTR